MHSVVVLLPLAALGGLAMAAMPSLRRRFGVAVLLLAAAGVAAVPLATQTGNELESTLPPNNPLIEEHEELGDQLLPFALVFGATLLLLVIAGRLADRERGAAQPGADTAQPGTDGDENRKTAAAPRTWRRMALVAAALVAVSGVAVTVQVVRAGHSGAAAVWEGVGVQR